MERSKAKRRVIDLSSDCRDGLLLAEVIEAVTNFKVPDLIKKPKTQQQMVSDKSFKLNVYACEEVANGFDRGGKLEIFNDAINLNLE